jgi:eukaryotic-like serine/threonine-protein kinase
MNPIERSTWIGRLIDQYEVKSLIGAGGMGVVYRARDTRLGRDVAVKVLREEFSQDRERMLRSEREARLLASLNHPNIAAIYDMKESGGTRCLILEYVAGETLAERIGRGRLSMAEALEICRQIAGALEAAHRAGIVHRDIKTANIKVTPEGVVKVLDFGLAKLFAAEATGTDSSDEPTLITQTLPEQLLGTPAYMSPEQVRGGIVDRRADVWAFGCVMFELLTGSRAFDGGNVPEIIASVLKTDPDWTALPEQTPAQVQALVRHCLEKDPARRFNEIAEVRVRLNAETHDSHDRLQTVPSVVAVRSLAVLPFVNASNNPEMDYLSDGLTESIIFSLSQLSELRVMSRSSVFRYKDRSGEAQIIGGELGVGAVLTGRVLQRGEMLQISVELVDVKNGWQLWGDQYRRKSADIVSVEQEIAREISEKLRLKLAPEKKSFLARRYTENVAAYHLYLKGKFHWGKRTAESLQRSIQYFREAIEGDPTYALAYAGLAEAYVPLGFYCHLAPTDAYPKARAAAEKALAIDPDLAEARAVVAAIKSSFDWDPAAGEREARLAIQLDPKYPRARQALAECLMVRRLFAEAIEEVKRGLDLDPLSLHMNAAVSMDCHFARRYEEAIEYGRRTIEMDANFFPGYFYSGLAYIEQRQYSEAVAALQRAAEISSNSPLMLAALASAFAFWGKLDDAQGILRQLEELRHRKYVSQVSVAAIYAGLGEIDRALACLEEARRDRCAWLLRAVVTDPRLDRLRGDERFHNLARSISI